MKLVSVLLMTCCAVAAPSAQTNSSQAVFRLLNSERERAGVSELAWNDKLAAAAKKHAELMAKNDDIPHQFPGEATTAQRIEATGLHFAASGENTGEAPTAQQLHDAWMASPPHHANMISPKFNAVGIAIVERDGSLYAVEDFAFVRKQYEIDEAERLAVFKIQERRRAKQIPELETNFSEALRSAACRERDGHQVASEELPPVEGVHHYAVYSTHDPEQLSPDMEALGGDKSASRMYIGACYGASEKNPGGVYWFAVEF